MLDLTLLAEHESGFGIQWQGMQPSDFDLVLQHLIYVTYNFESDNQHLGLFVLGSHGKNIGNLAGLDWNLIFPFSSSPEWGFQIGATLLYSYDAGAAFVTGTGGISYNY